MAATSLDRECKRCHRKQPLECFSKRSVKIGGYNLQCKECVSELRRDRCAEIQAAIDRSPDAPHHCKVCDVTKTRADFSKRSAAGDGMESMCRECRRTKNVRSAALRAQANKTRVLVERKTCSECREEKDAGQFFASNTSYSGLSNRCRECNSAYGKEKQRKFIEYKRSVLEKEECIKCGVKDWRVFHLAHRDRSTKYRNKSGKLQHPSALGNRVKWDAEKKLCDVMCACCHRLETIKEGGPRKQSKGHLRRTMDKEKLRRGACMHCARKVASDTTGLFDFDHKDPETKRESVSVLAQKSGPRAHTILVREMALCTLLCANCHLIKTREDGSHDFATRLRVHAAKAARATAVKQPPAPKPPAPASTVPPTPASTSPVLKHTKNAVPTLDRWLVKR